MKHRKIINRDTEKLQQTLYTEEFGTKNTSQFTGFSEPFRKTPCAQILSDKDIIIMTSSVTFASVGARKGKEGRQMYQAYIHGSE